LLKNVVGRHQDYITRFVSISTPWGGHEAVEMGVKWSPEVVPAWHDMVVGSDFQKGLFSKSFAGRLEHLLIYGHRAKRGVGLPPENDGTVSVKSELAEGAVKEAAAVVGFDEDHVGILSARPVIDAVEQFLDGARPVSASATGAAPNTNLIRR
jgi:hypothetical protein